MKTPVIQRFNKAIEYLLSNKIAKTKKELAKSIGVSPSYFSEILKKRINLSAEHLQTFLIEWPINPSYIFSISDQISAHNPYPTSDNMVGEPVSNAYSPHASSVIEADSSNKLHPTRPKKLHPTLHPTPKKASPTASPTPENAPELPNGGLPQVVTVDKTGEDNVVMVPLKARAGYLLGYGDVGYISELPSYNLPHIGVGTFRAFEVDGYSMSPTLCDSDIVVAEWVESFDHITDDRIYVIVTRNKGIVVKRVLNRINKYGFLVAKSDAIDNRSAYPNLQIRPEEINEVWYVKSFISSNLTSPVGLYQRMGDVEAGFEEIKQLLAAKNKK